MKKLSILLSSLMILCGAAEAVGVYEAMSSGHITLSGQSSSGYSESKLIVKNTRSYAVDVDFSTACFVQNNASQRIGLAYEKSTGAYYLRLSAGASYTLYFSSRCLDSTRSSPSTGVAFRIVRSISSFPEITNCLRKNYSQSYVWSVTNGIGSVARRWQAADPRTPPGGGGGGTPTVDLQGSTYWSASGSRIDIHATKVINTRASTTGSLRLRVWVTRSRYTGGTIYGYVIGTRNLGTLRSGYSFGNIKGSVSYTRPPAGTYYSSVVLEEYTPTGWTIVDFSTSQTSQRFR